MTNMFNRMPHFVYINNEKYFINTDFRIFVDFEKDMQDKNQKQAVLKVLNRFYPAFLQKINNKESLNEAIDKFIWFYKCGKSDVERKATSKKNKNLRLYDYDYDSDLIWRSILG